MCPIVSSRLTRYETIKLWNTIFLIGHRITFNLTNGIYMVVFQEYIARLHRLLGHKKNLY